MPARRSSGRGRRRQEKKGWRQRKHHDEPEWERLKIVCPVAGLKGAYRSRHEAEAELSRILEKPDVPGEKKPRRAYECDDGCGWWHLTSLEEPETGEDAVAADA